MKDSNVADTDIDFSSIRITVSKNLVHQELDGEMVILDMQSGQYFGIDHVGSRIWQMLEEKMPPAEMIEQLLKEYEVAADICRRQVTAFLHDMEQNQLISISRPK